MPLCLLVTLVTVPEPPSGPRHPPGWRQGVAACCRDNRPFRRLLAAYVLNGLASGLPASLFLLFVAHVLDAPAATGALLVIYFVRGIVALPGWLWLSRRLGKHRSWAISMIWASAVFAWVPFLGPGDVVAFGVICALSGVSVAVDMALPAAMQADLVDLDTGRGGDRRTGLVLRALEHGHQARTGGRGGDRLPAAGATRLFRGRGLRQAAPSRWHCSTGRSPSPSRSPPPCSCGASR
ncbi:MAG: MFS transporter [Arhodomonas sp.]|nr:MFS transporter [Arhodomonas sp.]